MLIPFGWLASSGAGANPSMELITSTFLAQDTATVTFSSIPQIYQHLQIRWTGRNTQSWGATGAANMHWYQMNGVVTASYSAHGLRGNGSSASAISYTSIDSIRSTTSLANAFGTSGSYSAGVTEILDYTSTSKNKTLRALTGYTSNTTEIGGVDLTSGALYRLDAITSITMGAGNGPGAGGVFASGSRFSLYGIKGA